MLKKHRLENTDAVERATSPTKSEADYGSGFSPVITLTFDS